MADETGHQPNRDQMLRHHYEQVCNSYRAIDDFRGKLLALWPVLGGTSGGVAVVLLATDRISGIYLLPIGLFGLLVSTGLAVYEWSQTLRCDQLKKSARELERLMGLDIGTGQFLSLPRGFRPSFTGPPLSELRHLIDQKDREREGGTTSPGPVSVVAFPIRVGVASLIVYGSVLLGWFGLLVWGAVLVWAAVFQLS